MNEKGLRERVRRSQIQKMEMKDTVEKEGRDRGKRSREEIEGRDREERHMSIDGGNETRRKRQRDEDWGGETEGRTRGGK